MNLPPLPIFYKQLIKNLTRHFSELLITPQIFKNAPEEFEEYPCVRGGVKLCVDFNSLPILKEMRKGGIFLTAHYGNYEALGAWVSRLGLPLKSSFAPLKPSFLNQLLKKRIRAVKYQGKPYEFSVAANSPKDFLNLVDNHFLFCLVADQDARGSSAKEETLLGSPVKVNPLPDFIRDHRPQVPAYLCWIQEAENGKVRTLHALKIPEKTHNSTVFYAYNRWLEQRIQENPSQWYSWTHRRFYSLHSEIY